jgi:hypothetical protein
VLGRAIIERRIDPAHRAAKPKADIPLAHPETRKAKIGASRSLIG